VIALGVGLSSKATFDDLLSVVRQVLAEAGVAQVHSTATVDRLASDPRVVGLGWAVQGFAADELTAVSPSVCESAALLAAGPHARLLVPKRRGNCVTAALASSTALPDPAATSKLPGDS
jgi:cobalamin biosynthesis protein CbiG